MRNRRRCFALIALAVGGALPALAQGGVTVPVVFAEARGCYVAPEGTGLWSSVLDPTALYFEAEDAQGLTFQEGFAAVEDDGCGGGACVARVTHAEFPLRITEGGTYRGWARAFLPVAGSWTHTESMDGGAERTVRDSTAQVFGRWYWTPLGEYSLTPGEHTFTLHSWLGGARLDAIIFSADADFDPTKLAGIPAGPEVTSGTTTTRPVRPSAVARWQRVEADADLNGGALTVEASADGGASWQAVPADGDLSAIPAAGDGQDALLVRFTLTAAADGASPVLRAATVSFELAPDAEIALETPDYRIAVAAQTGALAGVRNLALGIDASPQHLQEPFVGLAVREPGAAQMRVIPPTEFAFEGITEAPGRITIDFSALDRQVRVHVELATTGSALSDWTISVDNRSALEIIRVDFPVLRNLAIGDFRDDEAILPDHGGLRVPQPATDREYVSWYLGSAAMSWMDLQDGAAGLYVAMLDRALTTTEMVCSPAAGARGADLQMRTHTLIAPGATTSRSYQVGVHPGDWHWAADRYREWALSWMTDPQTPDWVRWTDGWVGASGVPFAHMTDVHDQARLQGIGYLQYWAQMADGIDQCCGNFYWPAPALGGAEGFTEGIARVHARGGRVTGYMNCQTWTRDAPINESLRLTPKSALPQEALDLIHPLDWFERWRLEQIDGSALGYYASTLGWYIMCPASTGFQEHLRFWIADMYAGRFGADGVYIDQTGATAAKPCYNLDHGHEDIGAWGAGNVEMLRSSLAAARAVNPDFMIAIEGSGDALGQYADLHLVSGVTRNPEIYHYTFPKHILISGLSNSSQLTAEQRISRAFLNGDRYDSRVEGQGLNSALRLRRRIKQWLYPARFMDDVGLRVSDPAVLARWNLCDEPGQRAIVITFDNETRTAGATCALELPAGWERPETVCLFDREGGIEVQAARVTHGVLEVGVPASTIAAALALYEVPHERAVDVVQVVIDEGALAGDLVLNAANLSAQPLSATITPEAPEPLSCPGGALTVDLPARGTVRVDLPVVGVADLKLPTPIMLGVAWPGGARASLAEVRPILLNPDLNIDADGDGTPDYWVASGSRSADFVRGMGDGGAWIDGQEGQTLFLRQHVPLRPSTEYYLAGEIKRAAGAGKVYAGLVEHVGERGIRMHGIGDAEGLAADTWQRFETTFTTGDDFRATALYLYNNDSAGRAWFRNFELQPVE